MRWVRHLSLPVSLLSLLALLPTARGDSTGGAPVVFSRDVLPILSENCFRCHGPDEKTRKAKLRLDIRSGAMRVLVPGKSAGSELIRRISADEDEQMPPPRSGRQLSAAQKEALRRWVDQGASWGRHWSYETPHRPELPAVKNTRWARNAIDRFVLARLEREGLTPSPEAAKETLLRRVSLDLTGLPPTPAEIDAFLADRSPDAYERVVDRLLASERYGERMAMDWLDGARFADTNGYQNDFARTMWPWRDWVIDAFNRNMPFDQFTVEQIAGDMLPGAKLNQKIASGFNRNHRTVTEAGSIDEEWRVENNVDRVETTATVFLGLTMGCARCHDHKYDPLTQKEFYRFFAFFNSINERGVYTEQRGNVPPLVALPSPADRERLKQFDAALAGAEKEVRSHRAAGRQGALVRFLGIAGREVREAEKPLGKLRKERADYEKKIPTVMVMEELPKPRDTYLLKRGRYDMPDRSEKLTPGVPACLPPLPAGVPNNRLGLARWLVGPANPLTARVTVNRFWQHYFGVGLVKTTENFGIQGELPSHPDLLDWLATEFIGTPSPHPLPLQGERARVRPSPHPLPLEGERARVRPSPHPLPLEGERARVRGWDVKAMQRLIVTSATYRQSSRATPELIKRDPENRLLARGPRFRLPAEVVRDNALAIAGLLVEKVSGPSVKPYQPAGLWEELAGGAGEGPYVQDKGPNLYRRSLYVYRKRTVPHPAMTTFDAPSREVCQVKRSRTDTPLQALVLLNDVTYVEAARRLAERMLTEGGRTAEERLTFAFRRATARKPRPDELQVLARGLERYRRTFRGDAKAAKEFIRHGDSPVSDKLDVAELAACTAVASIILNLDETITKE